MGNIFISYNHSDQHYVTQLKHALRDQNFKCWAHDDIEPGVSWSGEIRRQLASCDAFILVMTPDSEKSHWVESELKYAIENKKPIFPLLLDGNIWWQINQDTCVDVRGGKLPDARFYVWLTRAVKTQADPENPPSPSHTIFNIYGDVLNSNVAFGKDNKVESAHHVTHAPQTDQLKPTDPPSDSQNPTDGSPKAPVRSPNFPLNTSKDRPTMPRVSTNPSKTATTPPKVPAVSPPKRRLNIPILAATFLGLMGIMLCAALIGITPWLSSIMYPEWTATPTTTRITHPLKPTEPVANFTPTPQTIPSKPVIELTPLPETTTEKDSKMVLIPTGPFIMGSNNERPNEKPAHTLTIPAFYMDVYEVSNKLYKACVAANRCQPPTSPKSHNHNDYYNSAKYNNYPVIYVSWNMAKAYCEWRSPLTHLPSEAEWEKAARGPSTGSTIGGTYPWGEGIDTNHANYNANDGDTEAVDSNESGKSFYGIYNMAGNVSEWVSDWFDVYPGGDANASSDFGQTYRALRGGSWNDNYHNVRSSYRNRYAPTLANDVIGFRCARSIP